MSWCQVWKNNFSSRSGESFPGNSHHFWKKSCFSRPDTMTSFDELRGEGFELLDELRYDDLLPFAARYFFEKTSWITRLHHALSLIVLGAIIAAVIIRGIHWLTAISQFLLGLLVMFVVVLPLHEGLHALAYRMAGAR